MVKLHEAEEAKHTPKSNLITGNVKQDFSEIIPSAQQQVFTECLYV